MKRLLLTAATAATCAAIAVPALAATKSVTVTNNRFGPRTLTVKRGTVVRWRWARGTHNVTVVSGPQRFRSGNRTAGAAFSHRMTRRGTYRIVCTIHPGMTMTLRVVH